MRESDSLRLDVRHAPPEYVRTQHAHEAVLADAQRVFDLEAELPEWVFRKKTGIVNFDDESLAMGEAVPIIESLITHFGDATVSTVAKDYLHRPKRRRRKLDDCFLAFTMPASEVGRRFTNLQRYDPDDSRDPYSRFQYTDLTLIFGSSGRWGLYKDLDRELTLLWVDVDEPFWPQPDGHRLTNARGGAELTEPTFRNRDEYRAQSTRLIEVYAPHDPWRRSPARDSLDLTSCRAWLDSVRGQDASFWADVQEIVWASAVWDLHPEAARGFVRVDRDAFDLDAIMAWLEDQRKAGPEPWLEAQALLLDLVKERSIVSTGE